MELQPTTNIAIDKSGNVDLAVLPNADLQKYDNIATTID